MKIIKPLVVAVALGLSVPSHAVTPTVDFPRLAERMAENIQRGMEHAKKMVVLAEDMHAQGVQTAMEIDNKNNAVANMIARRAAALQEVLRLEQLSRAAPAESVCGVLALEFNLNNAMCTEEVIRDVIQERLARSTPTPMEIHDENSGKSSGAGRGAASGRSISGNQSNAGTSFNITATAQAWEQLNQEQEDAIDRIRENKWGTEDGPALDPNLLIINNLDTYQYTEAQFNKALDLAKIIYPHYVRKSLTDPVNEREVVREERNRAIVDLANAVVQRHIALRASDSEETPSKMLSLAMASELDFMGLENTGEMSANPTHELMRLAVDADTTPAKLERADVLNKAVKVNQMLENWKSQLLREQIIATLLLARLDPPSSAQ